MKNQNKNQGAGRKKKYVPTFPMEVHMLSYVGKRN